MKKFVLAVLLASVTALFAIWYDVARKDGDWLAEHYPIVGVIAHKGDGIELFLVQGEDILLAGTTYHLLARDTGSRAQECREVAEIGILQSYGRPQLQMRQSEKEIVVPIFRVVLSGKLGFAKGSFGLVRNYLCNRKRYLAIEIIIDKNGTSSKGSAQNPNG